MGQQPRVADGAREKQAESIYVAIHLETGAEATTFCIDWQDSDATIQWLALMLREHPRGQIRMWIDGACIIRVMKLKSG